MTNSISIRNVKGLSGDYKLGKITIVIGDNAVGKSALLSSIVIDAVGFDPSLGAQHNATRQLSSGKVMSISSDHGSYSRTQSWGTKYEIDPPEAKAPFLSADMVSLSEFSKLTAAGKTKYLLSKCGSNVSKGQLWDQAKKGMIDLGYVAGDLTIFTKLFTLPSVNSIDLLEQVSAAVDQTVSNTRSELRGAQAATSEIVSQDSTAMVGSSLMDVQPEIDNIQSLLEAQYKLTTEANSKLATARANSESTRRLGNSKLEEYNRALSDKDHVPTCSRCKSKIPCPVCSENKAGSDKRSTDLKAEMDVIRVEHKKLKQEVVDLEAAYNLEVDKSSKFDSKLAVLRQKQAQWHASLGKRQAAASATDKIGDIEKKLEIWNRFKKVIAEVTAVVLSDSIGIVLEKANLVIHEVLGFKLEYSNGNFGYSNGSQYITMATLSGTQSAIVCAGIQYALAIESPEKIMIVDELGRLGDSYKAKLMAVISKLIKQKKLDQFIGAEPNTGFGNRISKWFAKTKGDLDDQTVGEIQDLLNNGPYIYGPDVTIIEIKSA